MIKSEEERRAEAEQEAQEFADYIAQQDEEPPKKKKPTIETSSVVLSVQPFNLDTNSEESRAESDGGGGGPCPGCPPCPGCEGEPTGACCAESGACDDTGTESDCEGTWEGDDTTCSTVDCSGDTHVGACCITGAGCFDGLTPTMCEGLGGDYQGDGTDCTVDCPSSEPGACCPGGGGACYITTEDSCVGEFQGEGTVCAVGVCDHYCGTCIVCVGPGLTGNLCYAEASSTACASAGGSCWVSATPCHTCVSAITITGTCFCMFYESAICTAAGIGPCAGHGLPTGNCPDPGDCG